jgi:hypothetical protein
MDNGEASTLFAIARSRSILGGVLFQPYIELAEVRDPARLRDDRYGAACCLQAEIVLQAGSWLGRAGQ